MSFPLPHVLVLLNLLRSSRLSTRWAGRFGDERRLLAIAMAMLMSSDAMRISLGCVFLGSLCSPSVHRPASSTRMAGRGTSEPSLLLRSDFYRLLLSLAAGADLLACSYVIGRISPAMRDFCGSRSLRLPWLLRRDILSLCREGG